MYSESLENYNITTAHVFFEECRVSSIYANEQHFAYIKQYHSPALDIALNLIKRIQVKEPMPCLCGMNEESKRSDQIKWRARAIWGIIPCYWSCELLVSTSHQQQVRDIWGEICKRFNAWQINTKHITSSRECALPCLYFPIYMLCWLPVQSFQLYSALSRASSRKRQKVDIVKVARIPTACGWYNSEDPLREDV